MSKTVCKAQDPATCRYHGDANRWRPQDFDEYLTVRDGKSELEHTLTWTHGINIVLRTKLRKAYLDAGKPEVLALLQAHQHQVAPDLYPRLLELAENEDALDFTAASPF